jgi:5-methylcytosine-specific restriction protein A
MKNARPPIFRAPWLPSRAQQLAAFRDEQRRFNPQAPAAARGYDADWRTLRAAHLAEHPFCRACAARGIERRAHMVDHIEPIRQAPERRLDPSNLQSLCWRHHASKTQREIRSGGE